MQEMLPSFADKFSKFKVKFLIGFWLFISLIVLNFSFPILHSIYSIMKAQVSFYKIEIEENNAKYLRVETMPSPWVPLSKISKKLQGAIISSEDGKFYFHSGYDPEQLQKAFESTFVLKKKMRGGSTITQQLVKNLFLNKNKNLARKGIELMMAVMYEKHSDKNKILETYLNIIEYGKGLYGIGPASQFYFNKSPDKLTARESAFLAMLLPSPVKYSKSFKQKFLTPFALRIIDSILLKMKQGGYIGDVEYEAALTTSFNWERANPDLLKERKNTSEEDLLNDSEQESE